MKKIFVLTGEPSGDKLASTVINKLKQIPDERGAIYHMLRRDNSHFIEFGEIYFSIAFPGKIKGWHEHTKQIQNYAVIYGKIKLVLFLAIDAKIEVTNDFSVLFILISFSVAKILSKVGKRIKVTINETVRPKVIIQPKSIIGFISLKIRDRKAQIVVRTV